MKKPICAPAQSSSRRSPRRDFQKTGAIKKDATVKRAAMKANVEECFRAPVTTTKVAPQKSEHRARERSAFNRWLMRKPLRKVNRRTDETMECRGRRPRRQYARPANRLKSTCEGRPGEEKDAAGADAGSPAPPEAGKTPRTNARLYSMLGSSYRLVKDQSF